MKKTLSNTIKASILIALVFGGATSLLAAGGGTLPILDQFTSTTTPVSAITQSSWGKKLKITGLTTGQCLSLDSNSIVTTSACSGGGGGNTFGQGWEINGSGQLAPTTTIDVLIPQSLQFITNDLPTRMYVSNVLAGIPNDNLTFDIGNFASFVIDNNGVYVANNAGLHSITDLNTGLNILDNTNVTTEVGNVVITTTTAGGFAVSSGVLSLPLLSDGCLQTSGTNVTSTGAPCASSGGGGTVTSVDMSVPTGLSISGNPITTNGTLALSLTSGYTIPVASTLWATTSQNYYASQFRDLSVQGNGYLAPTTTRGIIVNASSTIPSLTVVNGTTTNATTTNLVVSSVQSSLLKTTSTGLITSAIAGTDYLSSAFRDWSLQGSPLYLAPTTSQAILVNNSTSTITNLLVVNGTTTSATSTNLYTSGQTILAATSGKVGIASTTPTATLSVAGDIYASSTLTVFNGGNGLTADYSIKTYTDKIGAYGSFSWYDTNRNQAGYIDPNGHLQITANHYISLGGSQYLYSGGTSIFDFRGSSSLSASGIIWAGKIGISTTSPYTMLAVAGTTTASSFVATSTTEVSNFQQFISTYATTSNQAITSLATAAGTYLAVDQNGVVIATTSPSAITSNASAYKQASNWATTAVLAGTPTYANGSSGVGATLTEVGSGALSVDGNSPAAGDRVLVKNQASGFQNGIYTVTATGSGIASYILTRSTDFNNVNDIFPGVATYVIGGTVNVGDTYVLTNTGAIVVGTTNLTFAEIGFGALSASNGITLTGNALSLDQTFAATWTGLEKFNAGILGNFSTSTITNLLVVNGTTTNATSTNIYASTGVAIATTTPAQIFAVQGNAYISGTTFLGATTTSTSTSGFNGALSSLRALSFQTGTTTTWTSTTSGPYIAKAIAPFTGTIRNARCSTDAGFLNVDFYHTSTHLTLLLGASSTVGTVSFTANNTFNVGEPIYMSAGTTTTSLTTSLACTLGITETP